MLPLVCLWVISMPGASYPSCRNVFSCCSSPLPFSHPGLRQPGSGLYLYSSVALIEPKCCQLLPVTRNQPRRCFRFGAFFYSHLNGRLPSRPAAFGRGLGARIPLMTHL